MNDVFFARAQFGVSLAFHIVFAAVGVGMPLLMVLAEWRWSRTGDAEWLELAKRWAKGTAVFFAVGAVSGTVLSFELGLLFPRFMEKAGAVVGLPFALEGFAFFTEAIFLGVYLYGWDKVSTRVHLFAGVVVAASGAASAAFVTTVNAWMNCPTGVTLERGQLVTIDHLRVMANPFTPHEVVHGTLAAYMATAFAVAGIHAWALLRGGRETFHKKALALALCLAIPTALVQPAIGHHSGQVVARWQPLKLAAMEQLEATQKRAPFSLGPLHVPGLLSVMAFGDPDAVVQGFDAFPPEDRPSAAVKPAFLVMVGLGTAAAGYAALTAWLWWRRRAAPDGRTWLRATLLLAPSGLLALEAGWLVTELGRQPWVIYELQRTAEAATPVPHLAVPFATFSLVYLGLAGVVAAVLRSHVRATTAEAP